MKLNWRQCRTRSIALLRRGWKPAAGVLLLLIIAAVVLVVWPMDTQIYLSVKPSGEMQDRNGKLMYPYLNTDENWCFERPLDQISPKLIAATLATEDHRFDYHPGVDPVAVLRAAGQNLSRRRAYSGASTLTMQVVKFHQKPMGRLWSKITQAINAVRLRVRVTKQEILWAYLNNAPYGANLVGCEAAARRYFGKSAMELTLAEAALLAGLPKAPTLFMPLKYPRLALQRRNLVLRRMWEEGFIGEDEYKRAIVQPLGVKWNEFPKMSPHLAMQLNQEVAQTPKRVTTLDFKIQEAVERQLKRAVKRTRGGVSNAAALVVDASTAQVLARAGSADFWNVEAEGQVDVCMAPRSPGSALKPFAYAMAMENNQLYACEMLLDDYWDKGLYNPENFDLSFDGLISAAEALRRSRNVPAVTLLERVGVEPFHRFLLTAGLKTLNRGAEQYGLGLTLGNCEVRLEELVTAYTALARLGEWSPLQYRMDRLVGQSQRLLSRGTCIKLYEMMEQPLPNDLAQSGVYLVNTRSRVCWKTGTSQGYRDAWTFVFNRQYVVGVWLGNNDGHSHADLIGMRLALPLAAEIFRHLPERSEPAWPNVDGNLHEVYVCAISGLPASTCCKKLRREFLPREQFLNRVCDMHYPSMAQDGAVQERWPASAQGWNLARIEIPFIKTQSENQKEKSKSRSQELRILTPADEAEYILTGEENGDRILLKTSQDSSEPIHWYLNQNYIGLSQPNQPLFLMLQEGMQKLTCMTDSGQVDTVTFNVIQPELIK